MVLHSLTSYDDSKLDPEAIYRYARKVARQAAAAGLPFLPKSPDDPVWLVAAAPAEASRTVRRIGDKHNLELDHEGVIICLRPDGALVKDTYSYGKSWPISEPETFDEDKVHPLNVSAFDFRPLDLRMLTYLDVGRDRWHDVHLPRDGSAVKREELNSRRNVIVHAKGVGLSRALRDLYVRAGGEPSRR